MEIVYLIERLRSDIEKGIETDAITISVRLIEKRDEVFKQKDFVTVPDIRNKLSPIATLIDMLERDEIDFAKNSIKQSKVSINYLSKREVYTI